MANDPEVKEQDNQILDMLDELVEPSPVEVEESVAKEVDVPEEKVEAKDEVVEEEKVDVEEDTKEDSEEVEEPVTMDTMSEEEVDGEEPIEVADPPKEETDDRISALQEQLESVASKAMSGAPQQAVDINQEQKSAEQIQKENEQDVKPDKEKKVVRDLIPFVNDEVYEKAISDPSELNRLMNTVYDNAISYMTQSIPQLVGQMVNQQTQMTGMVEEFYKENEDLVPMKNYVGFVANELASKHPDWAYDKLFGEVATEVRKRVSISKKASSVENKAKGKRPAFAKKPSGRSNVGVKLGELEQDIVDLMN
jgi:hypothetical protein